VKGELVRNTEVVMDYFNVYSNHEYTEKSLIMLVGKISNPKPSCMKKLKLLNSYRSGIEASGMLNHNSSENNSDYLV
jgi:hypothetical protein